MSELLVAKEIQNIIMEQEQEHQVQQPLQMKTPIVWNDQMNIMLCREVETVNPFRFKERTKERGKAWDEVAANLNILGHPITKRSVRDRYKVLKDGVKKKNEQERRQSGIAPELTGPELEITQMVEDMAEIENETRDQQHVEEKKKINGVEMRKRALESFTETSNRLKSEKSEKDNQKTMKRRNTGNDVNEFLQRKLDYDKKIREQELQLRKEEAERRQEDERRRWEREEREEEKRRERDRHMDLLQQQLLQQNQLIMMMLKKKQEE